MKIIETIKKDNIKKVMFLGIGIYEQKYRYSAFIIKEQKILNGLISTIKKENEKSYLTEKNIKILGKSFITIIEKEDIGEFYLGKKIIKKYSIIRNFYNKYKKYINKKYDGVYILNANSGESCLFLAFLFDSFVKKNKTKTPLLVATKPYHIDLIKMFCPEIPYVYLKQAYLKIKKDKFDINNQNFYMLFTHIYFLRTETEIKNNLKNDVHYFNSMQKHLNLINLNSKPRNINISREEKESAFKKAKKAGLDMSNFIFVAPEAQSCLPINIKYWKDLINEYKTKGYDVYVNLTDFNSEYKQLDCKYCDLTFTESYILASHSKKIVALRSGLCELLAFNEVPIEVLYTKAKNGISAELFHAGFKIIPCNENKLITNRIIGDS